MSHNQKKGLLITHSKDELARVIQQYPERFAGFAAISPEDSHGAVAEIELTVKEMGFKGANINSHINGESLDDLLSRSKLRVWAIGYRISCNHRLPESTWR